MDTTAEDQKFIVENYPDTAKLANNIWGENAERISWNILRQRLKTR